MLGIVVGEMTPVGWRPVYVVVVEGIGNRCIDAVTQLIGRRHSIKAQLYRSGRCRRDGDQQIAFARVLRTNDKGIVNLIQ